MKPRLVAVALVACFATNAGAQTAPTETLDLSLPPPTSIYGEPAVAPYAADPPGKYYGDTSGRIASQAQLGYGAQAGLVDDCEKARVSGSFTTGIGHAEGRGTSYFNALDLNINKCFDNGEHTNYFNFNIHVSDFDGPGFGTRRPYGGSGWYPGFP